MKKKITKLLILSVFLTVLLPAGIVCTVLGAVRGGTAGNIMLGGAAKAARAFVYTQGAWRAALPKCYVSGAWHTGG